MARKVITQIHKRVSAFATKHKKPIVAVGAGLAGYGAGSMAKDTYRRLRKRKKR